MKKILYLLLLFTGIANAQIVNIPDANFKAKLLAADVTNDIAKNQALQNIKIDSNNDGEIQLSEALLIYRLEVQNSTISDLTGIQSFTNLNRLNCYSNQLTTLNLQGLTNLEFLGCSNNQLTSLDLNGFSLLEEVYCSYNNLTSLEVGTLSNLVVLGCEFNQLTSLNVEASYYLDSLWCHDNELIYLNVKNGNQYWFYEFLIWNNPNLQFLCVNEENILIGQAYLNDNGYTNCVVNSYCSFFPGGNYNTITGTTTFDSNNNGCDAFDLNFSNIRMNISDGTNLGTTFTNSNGVYTFYAQAGNFTLNPSFENPLWFNFSPTTATIPFADNNNNLTTQDFCISANGVHPDVEMVIVPITPARPGFDAVYKLVYRNKGNQTSEVFLNFTYNEDLLDFVSSSLTPNNNVNGHMSWIIQDLQPFQSGSVLVTLNVNAPTETPAVNIDDVLVFTSFIDISTDEIWADNAFTLNQIVVGSFDPNDIICLEGDIVSPTEIGNYLHYNVRFENTGTAAAENVVVKVEVNPADFDINSLQIMNTSNPVDARINGNKIEFIFQNIMLDSGGHGNVLLKMRTQPNLQQGDLVEKRANIYFDYNFPIETNDAETLFQALSNPSFEQDTSISIYPNPASSIINIKSNFNIKTIELYDVQGRLLQTNLINTSETSIDITSKSKGIYFIKITSEKGIKVEKIIKE